LVLPERFGQKRDGEQPLGSLCARFLRKDRAQGWDECTFGKINTKQILGEITAQGCGPC
jgi:hypothetical protein